MDAINVAIRLRPINVREKKLNAVPSWKAADDGKSIFQVTPSGQPIPSAAYAFDHIFGENAHTNEIYDQVIKQIISSTMGGINGTIFAYGQTSSGKTYTMMGTDADMGLIPLAVQDIFDQIQNTPTSEFLLRVSYLEIYNEVIKDLLSNNSENLKIHEDIERGIFVGDLKEEVVTSVEHTLLLMQEGEGRRHVGQTNMNDRSSRSHTIFRMVIESRPNQEAMECDDSEGCAVKVSTLTLVDLAGSERAAATGAGGTRLVEGGHINKSLLALSNVINKLSSEGSSGHIPYRDSKLTRILQPSLGGNTKTAIISAITPASIHSEETHSTLKFASRAKTVTNKPQINEVLDDKALLRRMKKQISGLNKKLQALESEDQNQKLAETLLEHEEQRMKDLAEMERLKHRIISATTMNIQNEGEKKLKDARLRRETWAPSVAAAMGFMSPLPVSKPNPIMPLSSLNLEKEMLQLKPIPPHVNSRASSTDSETSRMSSSSTASHHSQCNVEPQLHKLEKELTKERDDACEAHKEIASLRDLLGETKREKEILECTVTDLQSKMTSCEDEMKLIQSNQSIGEAVITCLKDEKQELTKKLDETEQIMKNEKDISNAQIDQLKSTMVEQSGQFQDIIGSLQDQLSSSKTELADTASELLAQAEQNVEIQSKYDSLLTELETIKSQQKHETEDSNSKLNGLLSQLSTSAKTMKNVESERDALKNENTSLTEEIQGFSKQIDDMDTSVTSKDNEIKELCLQLKNDAMNAQKTEEKYTQKLEKKTTQLNEAIQQRDEATSELGILQNCLDEVEKGLEEAEMQHMSQIQEIENQKTQSDEMLMKSVETLKTANEEIQSLNKQLDALKSNHSATVENETQTHEISHATIDTQTSETEHTDPEIKKRDDEKTNLLEEKTAEIEGLNKKIENLEIYAQQEKNQFLEEKKSTTVENEQLKTQVQTTKQEVADLQTKFTAISQNLDITTSEYQKSQSNLEAAQKRITDLQKDIVVLQDENEEKIKEINSQNSESTKIEETLHHTLLQLRTTQDSLLKATEELTATQQNVSILSTQIEEANCATDMIAEQYNTMTENYNSKSGECDDLQAKFSDLEATLHEKEMEITTLCEERDALRDAAFKKQSNQPKSQNRLVKAGEFQRNMKDSREHKQNQKEKAMMQKEIEKLKTKLKDVEAKLKQATVDKNMVIGERATMGQEIKQLRNQVTHFEKNAGKWGESAKQNGEKVKELSSALVNAEKKVSDLTKAIQKAQNEAYSATQLAETKSEEAKEESVKSQKLESEVHELKTSKQLSEEQAKHEKERADTTEQRLQETENTLNEAKTNLEKLLSQVQLDEEMITNLKAECENSETQLTQRMNDLTKLTQASQILQSELSKQKNEIEVLTTNLEEAETCTTDAEQRYETVLDELTETKFNYDEAKEQWSTMESDLKSEIEALKMARSALEQRSEMMLASSRLEAEQSQEKLEEEKMKLQEEWNKEKKDSEEKLQTIEKELNEKITKLSEEVDDVKAKSSEEKQTHETTQIMLQKALDEAMGEAECQLIELTEVTATIENLRVELTEKGTALQEIHKKLDQTTQNKNDADKLVETQNQEIAALKHSLAELNTQHTTLTKKKAKLDASISCVEMKGNADTVEIESLREKLLQVQSDKRETTRELRQLKKKYGNLEMLLKDSKKCINEMNGMKGETCDENALLDVQNQLKAAEEKASVKIKEFSAEINRYKSEMNDLKEELNDSRKETHKIHKMMKAMEKQMNNSGEGDKFKLMQENARLLIESKYNTRRRIQQNNYISGLQSELQAQREEKSGPKDQKENDVSNPLS